jgi:hypothetical protein
VCDLQKKLMTVSATDMSMAMHISQSSHPNCLVASLPAARVETTISARAGKKKLMNIAKIWSPDGAGLVGRASIEAASMTQNRR